MNYVICKLFAISLHKSIYSLLFIIIPIRTAESLCDLMGVIICSILVMCTLVIAFALFVFELSDSFNLEIITMFVDLAGLLVLTFVYYFSALT